MNLCAASAPSTCPDTDRPDTGGHDAAAGKMRESRGSAPAFRKPTALHTAAAAIAQPPAPLRLPYLPAAGPSSLDALRHAAGLVLRLGLIHFVEQAPEDRIEQSGSDDDAHSPVAGEVALAIEAKAQKSSPSGLL